MTRIVARGDDGTETDVTEVVETAYYLAWGQRAELHAKDLEKLAALGDTIGGHGADLLRTTAARHRRMYGEV